MSNITHHKTEPLDKASFRNSRYHVIKQQGAYERYLIIICLTLFLVQVSESQTPDTYVAMLPFPSQAGTSASVLTHEASESVSTFESSSTDPGKGVSSNPPSDSELSWAQPQPAQGAKMARSHMSVSLSNEPQIIFPAPISCIAFSSTLVSISASPDLGILQPDAFVALNTDVQLEGIAETQTWDTACNKTVATVPFAWSLSFQAPGGTPIDVSTMLVDSRTLRPKFIASDSGTYRAKLSAADKVIEKNIVVEAISPTGTWVSIGPNNVAGRTRAIAFDSVTRAMYAAADSGGVWKSANNGASWAPLTDNKLPTLKVNTVAISRTDPSPSAAPIIVAGTMRGVFRSMDDGATWKASVPGACANDLISQATIVKIAVHPTNPNVVYAGTDAGVFRTSNGGDCWDQVLSGRNIADLIIAKTTDPTIYASVWNVGIFRATEADPTMWTLLNDLSGSGLPPQDPRFEGLLRVSLGDKRLYISPADAVLGIPPAGTLVQAGAPDLITPAKPLARFACNEFNLDANASGAFDANDVIYRHASKDCNNQTFTVLIGDTRLTGPLAGTVVEAGDADVGAGLSFIHAFELFADINGDGVYNIYESIYRDAGFGKISLTVADSAPTILYAGFEPEPYQVYKSTDGGNTWAETLTAPHTCFGQQCYLNNVIAVDPIDTNIVYVGQVHLSASTNGGATWREMNGPNINPSDFIGQWIHDDMHAIVFDPSDPKTVYIGTDGGVFRYSIDPMNLKPNWLPQNEALATTQFYHMGLSPSEPFEAAGGLQDNGTLRRSSGKIWGGINGGDGFRTVYDASSTFDKPIIYYDRYWGRPPILRFPNGGIGGDGSFFADPFRKGNMLRFNGNLLKATDADTASPATWGCIDPTKANDKDVVTSVAFVRPGSLLALLTQSLVRAKQPQDLYYVGTDDGSIYLLAYPPGMPPSPDCHDPGPVESIEIKVFPPPMSERACVRVAPGAVQSIAVDPIDASIIYATFKGQGANRILRIKNSSALNWCAESITGGPQSNDLSLDPPPSLDNLSPFPEGLSAADIAVDPLDFDTNPGVYVATDDGVFFGKLQPLGRTGRSAWQWFRSSGMPNVLVTSLKSHENKDGVSGILRAATYGRGVFELVKNPNQQALKQGRSTLQQSATEDQITNLRVQEFSAPEDRYRVIHIKLNYNYQSDHGENVKIRATGLGQNEETGFFVTETQMVQRGRGDASLLITYAAQNAPLSLTTEAIRVDLFVPNQSPFFSSFHNLKKAWRKPGTRTLSVSAIQRIVDGSPSPVALPITVRSGSQNVIKNAEFDLTLEQGTPVTVHAPSEFTMAEGVAIFMGWSVVGHRLDSSPEISLTLSDDMALIANYELKKELPPFTLTVQSRCDRCSSNPDFFGMTIDLTRSARAQAIYTTFRTEIRAGVPFSVEAPATVRVGNRNLKFIYWEIGRVCISSRRLSLKMGGNITLTAIYRFKTY